MWVPIGSGQPSCRQLLLWLRLSARAWYGGDLPFGTSRLLRIACPHPLLPPVALLFFAQATAAVEAGTPGGE